MARLTMGKREMDTLLAFHPAVQREMYRHAQRIEGIAERKLASAQAAGLARRAARADNGMVMPPRDTPTTIQLRRATGKYAMDYKVTMVARNAWAIEYGHSPSGVFGEGGRYGHIPSEPPHGLYIMTMTYVQC